MHLDWSISKHVGREIGSAVLFAAVFLGIASWTARFLWRLGIERKMSRGYFVVVVVMIAAMVAVVMLPYGLVPGAGNEKSIVTLLHEIASRTLFIAMMLAVAMLVRRRFCVLGMIYIIYGAVCVAGYLWRMPWFLGAILIFETVYIVAFFGVVLSMKAQKNKKGAS